MSAPPLHGTAVGVGSSTPLGSTVVSGGANFSVFASDAAAVQLALFDRVEDPQPSRVIDLQPGAQRGGRYWHAFVPGIRAGQLYGYRADGPFAPAQGLRFDRGKLLVDPYARCIARPSKLSRRAACEPGDNAATAYRSVVADATGYDWQGDRAPRTPWESTLIYELHVGHFTRHPNSGIDPTRRGTFAGVMEKIPYLLELGVSAVEVMPVFAFDEQAAPAGLRNVWGYQPVALFAPHPGYGSRAAPLAVLDEFRDLVKALHRAGLEIILDVVYNHSAEGDADGPTWSFRGLANAIYYILEQDRARYADYSGTGNTLNAEHPVVRRMIVDSLRYWAGEMHVDGFRFDLAAALTRDMRGDPVLSPAVLRDIESDPLLADVKLIAEAWDAAGLYRAGAFAASGWREWNGRFRDEVRRFVKGDDGTVRALAARLTGSSDLYPTQRCEHRSVNFVTCHDGFTLNDLVSYDRKHNEANGEDNRDGADDNFSWNCGAEGPTQDPQISRLRQRQARNLLAIALLSAGTPMLLMGDEILRSQGGNNNAYCVDDPGVWFDWSGLPAQQDMLRFVRRLIALRRWTEAPLGHASGGSAGGTASAPCARLTPREITWHGVHPDQPDWSDCSHSLAATIRFEDAAIVGHLMVNAYWEPLEFAVPAAPDSRSPWRRCVDTFQLPPRDACEWRLAEAVEGPRVVVAARALVLLLAGQAGQAGQPFE